MPNCRQRRQTPRTIFMNETHGDLSRKVALVTGGSRGIGRAIALARADAGADVAINYLRRYDGADD